MSSTRFYFHDLELSGIDNAELKNVLDKIKVETENLDTSDPIYVQNDSAKLHIQIIFREVIEDETYYFGKLIQSLKTTDFKEERKGELIDIDLDDDSGICEPERGVIYFLCVVNSSKKFLMVEDVPFALNVGGIIKYLFERINNPSCKISTKQKLGRDLIKIINAVKDSEITLAKIRFKKNVNANDLKKIGVVEDALQKLKELNLDCELVLRWSKGKRVKILDFVKMLLKIEDVTQLGSVDYGGFLRTLFFQIDNEAHGKINMKDDILKYVPPSSKEYYFNHENSLFGLLKTEFLEKYTEGKLN